MAMKHTKRHAFINVTWESQDDIIENQSLLKEKQKGKIKGLHLLLIWTHTTREKLKLKQVYTLLSKARSVSEQKKEAFHLHPVVSKSPLKTNKILWSFFPLWKSAINILQQMIIDFYKAIYRLLKSWLFNPLGARKEEFSEVRTACSFPHQHGQNLQTPDFFFAPQIFFVVVDVAVLQHRINPFIPSHLRQIFFFCDRFLKYIACQIFIHYLRLAGWMLSRVDFMSENQQLLIYHTGH